MSILYRIVWVVLLGAALAGMGVGCSKEQKRERYLREGAKHLREEQFAEGEIAYLNLLRLDPANNAAIKGLAEVYYQQGRVLRSLSFLKEAVKRDPDDVELRVKLATTLTSVRRIREARSEAAAVLERQPGHDDALQIYAETSHSTNEIREVSELLQRLPAGKQASAAYHVALGSLHFRQRRIDEAFAEFERAVNVDPKSSAAHLALGNLYMVRNDPTNAEPLLRKAAELAPVRSFRRLAYAEYQLRRGDLEAASRLAEEVSTQARDYVPAWTLRLQLALATRKYDECSSLIQQIQSRDPGNPEAMVASGTLQLAQNKPEKAVQEYERAIEVYGNLPRVHYQLALAHLATKETAKAVASLNQAIAGDPDYAEAILTLADLNIRRSQLSPAISALTELTRKRPDLFQAHVLLATAYLQRRTPEDALQVYRKMLPMFPKSPQVPLLIGRILIGQGKKEEGRKALEQALERSQWYLPAIESLVQLDFAERQFASAAGRVREVVDHFPTNAEPHVLMAQVHMAQTNSAQAELSLKRAIELNPDLREAYLMLARLYVGSNQHERALAELETVLARRTNDTGTLTMKGIIHEHLKDYPSARDSYDRLLVVNPQSVVALNNAAYLYSERLQQHAKGLEYAERARGLAPADPSVADTLGWMHYRKGEYTRALALLQESAGKLTDSPEVRYHLGATYYMLGQEVEARGALGEALQNEKGFEHKSDAEALLALLALDPDRAGNDAVPILQKRLELEPADPVAISRLASIHLQEGAVDKAVSLYERGLKLSPENANLMFKLASLYHWRMQDDAKAMALAKSARKLSPENPEIAGLLGRLAFRSGDQVWGLSLLQEAARQRPEDPDLLCDNAWALYSLGRIGEAKVAMEQAVSRGLRERAKEASLFLELTGVHSDPGAAPRLVGKARIELASNPGHVPALFVSGLAQAQASDHAGASKTFESILAVYPRFSPAIKELAALYAFPLRNPARGFELATRAREALPNDSDVARILGILSYKRAEYSRAVQLLSEAGRAQAEDAETQFYLGMGYFHLKQNANSKAALERALRLKLDPELATEARKALQALGGAT